MLSQAFQIPLKLFKSDGKMPLKLSKSEGNMPSQAFEI